MCAHAYMDVLKFRNHSTSNISSLGLTMLCYATERHVKWCKFIDHPCFGFAVILKRN